MKKKAVLIFVFSLLVFFALETEAYAEDNLKYYINYTRGTDIQTGQVLNSGQTGWDEILPQTIPVKDTLNKDGRKTAFLTFDDGPSSNITPQILDILHKYNIKATFFIVGRMARNNTEIVKRIFSEGHSIANHSYSHEYSYIYSNVDNLMGEVYACDDVLKSILGNDFTTRVFRFPGGAFGSSYSTFKSVLNERGYDFINWNVETGDATGYNVPVNLLVGNVKTQSKGVEDIVVLMHDLGTKYTTAEALPSIIEYLMSQGYEFKKLK